MAGASAAPAILFERQPMVRISSFGILASLALVSGCDSFKSVKTTKQPSEKGMATLICNVPASKSEIVDSLACNTHGIAIGSIAKTEQQTAILRYADYTLGNVRKIAEIGDEAFYALSFFKHGQKLITCGLSGSLSVYDMTSMKLDKSFPVDSGEPINAIDVTGSIAGIVGDGKRAHLVDLDKVTSISVPGGKYPYKSCCFSPDGSYLLIADLAGSVRKLDVKTGSELGKFTSVSQVVSVAVSSDGKQLAIASPLGLVTTYDAHSYSKILQDNLADSISSIAYLPKRGHLAVCHSSGVSLLEATSLKVLDVLKKSSANSRLMKVSADGGIIAVAYDDSTIGIWTLD
nr:WD domain, G-beta repeat [uncultured bacterium]